ncbi:MAG TPA: dinitrogenase iron-molybdenum cofactor biosynthesis protein [Desulfobacteraceae bacterium]|nr:dinitrogenase iron-molybdenum cofactor biosynthesis protein [Desulfobacteraceae bacterium]
MKIAVSAGGKDLDAPIDPRFGRCAYFIFVNTDDMSFEAFDNESLALGGGAGIQASQFVASKGAKVVLTGNVGPNAVQTLAAAGVEVIVGQTGTVKQAIDDYKGGRLKSTSEPNVVDHYGMGGGTGGGMGRGMGRGMGGGMGRGMGGGMGAAGGTFQGETGPADSSRDQELMLLKDQAEELRNQMKDMEKNIKALEKDRT